MVMVSGAGTTTTTTSSFADKLTNARVSISVHTWLRLPLLRRWFRLVLCAVFQYFLLSADSRSLSLCEPFSPVYLFHYRNHHHRIPVSLSLSATPLLRLPQFHPFSCFCLFASSFHREAIYSAAFSVAVAPNSAPVATATAAAVQICV